MTITTTKTTTSPTARPTGEVCGSAAEELPETQETMMFTK